jgi:hypothetical protein
VRWIRAGTAAGIVFAALSLGAAPAGATVTGPCDGTALWQGAEPPLTVTASQIDPGDVVEIPLEGSVEWTGTIAIPPPDAPRDASGHVEVKLPPPFGLVQVGTWSTSGTLVGNSGNYTYDFPAILSGFEVTVVGKHWEGTLTPSGEPTCSGEVTLTLEGTNPIGFVAGGLSLVSIMGAYLAIRVRGGAL